MSLTRTTLGLRNTHLAKVGGVVALHFSLSEADHGSEIFALPCLVDQAIELVDLLQGETCIDVSYFKLASAQSWPTFRLVDECPDKANGKETGSTPDEEDSRLEIPIFSIDDIWCAESNDKVE